MSGVPMTPVARAQADRLIWLDRYRVCVTTDPHHSDRRWLIVQWLAAAHVGLEPESEAATCPDYGLSLEALDWLEDAAYRGPGSFVVDWSTFMQN